MKKQAHSNNFAILHFIGACMVMYGHQWSLLGGTQPSLFGCSVSNIGVKMIFVITGFLISQSYFRSGSFSNFIKRRLIRIFPALIACILLCTIFLAPISTLDFKNYFRWSWIYVWHNILLYPYYALPGVFSVNPYPNAVNGSLWTLPVEIVTYFVIGFALLLLNKSNTKKSKGLYFAFVMAVICLEISRYFLWRDQRIVIWGTDWVISVNLIVYMLIGSLFEVVNLKKFCNLQIATIALFVAICINYQHMPILALVVIPYFTMSFALCDGPIFAKCFSKNNIAYGVFLWSFPIQQTIIYFLCVKLQFYASANIFFLISLLPVVIVALLSHRYIETPIETYLKNKLLKK